MLRINCVIFGTLLAGFVSCQLDDGGPTIDPADLGPQSAGSTVNLECSCAPPCEDLLWFHNGVQQDDGPGIIITNVMVPGKVMSMLTLEDVDETKSGAWKCEDAEDPFSPAQVDLVIESGGDADEIDIEIFEPDTESVGVPAGEDISLACRGPLGVELEWLHNGMTLSEGDGIVINSNTDVGARTEESLLTKSSSKPTDGGRYICRDALDIFTTDEIMVNIEEASSDSGSVSITDPSGSSLRVSPGDSFTLTCESDQGAELVWYYEGEMLSSDDYLIQEAVQSGKTSSLLTKEDATEETGGKYSCQNANDPDDKATVDVTVSEEEDDENKGGTGSHVQGAMFVTCFLAFVTLGALLS